jgi:hypothetical protein
MEWFLIKQNEHLGPFNKDLLLQLYKDGKIQGESLLWHEGWKKPKSFDFVFNSSDLPPDLPPLPPEAFEAEVEQELPEHVKQVNVEKYEHQDIEEGSTPVGSLSFLSKNKKFIWAALFGIILLICGSYFLKEKKLLFSRPQLMELKDFERLKKVALSEKKLRFAIALGKDKKTIWIATNIALQGEVDISLKSVKNKILGEAVAVSARGVLKDRLISLSKFQFTKGARFIDGYYQLEINSLEPFEPSFIQRMQGLVRRELNYSGQFLITNLKRKHLKKQLKRFIKSQNSNTNLFWQELAQKYQTIKVITEQIKQGFAKVFIGPHQKWHQRVKLFENEYKSQYGIFFTEFVKANEASYEKLMKKTFKNSQEVLASYSYLSTLATDIGEQSMDILEELQTFDVKRMTPASKEQLRQNIMSKLEVIITKSDEKMSQLESN